VLDSAAHLVAKTREMLVKLVRVRVMRQVRPRLQLVKPVKVQLHQGRMRMPLQLARALRLALRWLVLRLSGRGPAVAASVSAGVDESVGTRTDRTVMTPPVVQTQASKNDCLSSKPSATVSERITGSPESFSLFSFECLALALHQISLCENRDQIACNQEY
jgi:hypothetical protein